MLVSHVPYFVIRAATYGINIISVRPEPGLVSVAVENPSDRLD